TVGDDLVGRYVQIGIYAMMMLLLGLRWKAVLDSVRGAPLLWILIGFATVSTIWSTDSQVTLRAGFWLFASSVFGIYLVVRFTPREQLNILAVTLGIILALSIIF